MELQRKTDQEEDLNLMTLKLKQKTKTIWKLYQSVIKPIRYAAQQSNNLYIYVHD